MNAHERRNGLAEHWHQLLASLGITRTEASDRAFVNLVTAYSESHRRYHTLDHVFSMLDQLTLVRHLTDSTSRFESENIQLATWYHDVVYDPTSSENEQQSAEVARDSLIHLGLASSRIERVCELIMLTRNHEAHADDWEGLLLLDLDLSILGANAVHYLEYSDGIRIEFKSYPDSVFYPGRRRVLERFLVRPKIFRSGWFDDREAIARANIRAEIAQIDDKLRSLVP